MKKLFFAVPCIVMGMVLGASALSEAFPVSPEVSAQSVPRTNIIVTAPFVDDISRLYGCSDGRGMTDCITDSLTTIDTDTTFKLIGGANAVTCGTTAMALNATCQYSQATFGGPACVDDLCPTVKIDPDQL